MTAQTPMAQCLASLLWPLKHLAERYYRSELAGQNRQTLDLYVANLLGTLHRYEVLPQIVGDLPSLGELSAFRYSTRLWRLPAV